MRYIFDSIKKNLILRSPRSGRLEGRTALLQPVGRVERSATRRRSLGVMAGSTRPTDPEAVSDDAS